MGARLSSSPPYSVPPDFARFTLPGRPYWLVVGHPVRTWAGDVLKHLAALECDGKLMHNDPQVRRYLTAMLDGSCTRVSMAKWIVCLEGLDEMCLGPHAPFAFAMDAGSGGSVK